MKVVILAGGKGTRISEESQFRPKPMVEIGGRPILWHIMKLYSYYGFHEFIICCGYKGYMIKQYFTNYYMHQSDVSFTLKDDGTKIENSKIEPWKVTLIDTGLETLTAGRVLRIRDYVKDESFMLTYGDGVGDIPIPKLLDFHQKQGKPVTISMTRPEGRFGVLSLDDTGHLVKGFQEKERKDQAPVNIGYMVMQPEVFDYLGDGEDMLEGRPFERLAGEGKMAAYLHEGFWSPMDSLRDRDYLEKRWKRKDAPWKLWD